MMQDEDKEMKGHDNKVIKETVSQVIGIIDAMCCDPTADVIWKSGAYIRNKYIAKELRRIFKL
jgi:hypothetical protein